MLPNMLLALCHGISWLSVAQLWYKSASCRPACSELLQFVILGNLYLSLLTIPMMEAYTSTLHVQGTFNLH